jgi:hypothetical protein
MTLFVDLPGALGPYRYDCIRAIVARINGAHPASRIVPGLDTCFRVRSMQSQLTCF